MIERIRSGMILLLAAFWCFVVLPSSAAADTVAPAPPSEAQVSSQEVETLVKTLEDPQQRERLIQQLRLLTKAQQPTEPEIASSTTAMLAALSRHVEKLGTNAMVVATSINQLPQVYTWLQKQAQNEEARQRWRDIFTDLLTIIGIAYLVFFVVRRLLGLVTKKIYAITTDRISLKLWWMLCSFLLNLLPLAAFAATAYIAAGVLNLGEQTRLAVLAWVNAILVARVVIVFSRALFAAEAPGWRLLKITDETAQYAGIWVRRLTVVPVYGYFILQVALYLGLQNAVYNALLRLLGLLVLGLTIVLVMQNRDSVAQWITGEQDASMRFRDLRRRFARIWHLVSVVYLLIVYGVWAADVPGGFVFLAKGTGLSLLAIGVGYIVIKLIEQGFDRGLSVGTEIDARFPELRTRANRYLPALQTISRIVVYILVLLAVLQGWGMSTFGWLASEQGRVMMSTAASIAGIVFVSLVVWETTSYFIEKYLATKDEAGVDQTSGRTRTLLTVARKALSVALIILATLLTLSELGVNIAPLLASAGVLGLAIGFGSQKLVQDVINGVFILLENLFVVGDVIKVGDTAGLVEAISIRNVRLRDFSGVVHTIPFSSISTISNLTKEFSFYVFDVGVAYREDVDEVIKVLHEIGEELIADPEFNALIKDPLEVFGVDRFDDSAVVIKARIKTMPIKQWTVGREFNRRMKNKFDELGIEIPFPHQTIYFGEDKTGSAPPAHVEITRGQV